MNVSGADHTAHVVRRGYVACEHCPTTHSECPPCSPRWRLVCPSLIAVREIHPCRARRLPGDDESTTTTSRHRRLDGSEPQTSRPLRGPLQGVLVGRHVKAHLHRSPRLDSRSPFQHDDQVNPWPLSSVLHENVPLTNAVFAGSH